jgi:hypothetical protein
LPLLSNLKTAGQVEMHRPQLMQSSVSTTAIFIRYSPWLLVTGADSCQCSMSTTDVNNSELLPNYPVAQYSGMPKKREIYDI